MKLSDLGTLPAVPWKNGGGVTRALACHPAGASFQDFVWRVSIAEVASSGLFSLFPGVDRVIALLDGAGMRLTFDNGRVHDLSTPLTPFRFRGEDPLRADLAGAASRDINLMLRRGAANGRMDVWRSAGDLACEPGFLMLFCASGSWQAQIQDGPEHRLTPNRILSGDCARIALRPLQPNSALLALHITTDPS